MSTTAKDHIIITRSHLIRIQKLIDTQAYGAWSKFTDDEWLLRLVFCQIIITVETLWGLRNLHLHTYQKETIDNRAGHRQEETEYEQKELEWSGSKTRTFLEIWAKVEGLVSRKEKRSDEYHSRWWYEFFFFVDRWGQYCGCYLYLYQKLKLKL